MSAKTSKKEITIYDIASEAGVSASTVSRVITRRAGVSEPKRAAVQQVISKYNFRPNAMARSLSDTRTHILGLLVADIRNPFYAALSVECEKAANRRGYMVMLCNMLTPSAAEDGDLEKLYALRVDAIIQVGRRVDDLVTNPAYAELVKRIARTIPFVVSGKVDGVDCCCFNIDHYACMRRVFEYLLSLGHRRIALIGGSKTVSSTYDKWQQYIYLSGKNDLPLRDGYMQEGDYTENGGYSNMNALLALEEHPTAVIAVNDLTAAGALKAAREHGIRVPEDISVISFDNTFLSELLTPKLTSVDYDYPTFGEMLVNTAIRVIHRQNVPKQQVILTELVIRDSCAPPPD